MRTHSPSSLDPQCSVGPDAGARAPGPGPGWPRIALAHDWLVSFRGGEAVLAAIAAAALDAGRPGPLYSMVASDEAVGRLSEPRYAPIGAFRPIRTSWLQRVPGGAGRLRRWALPLYPAAVADLSRWLLADHRAEPVDLVISTSSAAIKGLRTPDGVPHLCYCHAPARYLWTQAEQYARGRAGGLRAAGLRAFGPRLRAWDRRTSAGPTRFLANSTFIASEIRRCYGREAAVVFPPVRTEFFTPDSSVERGRRWLYAGALEPYKRVDLVIDAANRAGQELRIVGEGSQMEHLRALAGPTVRLLGRISDETLRDEYRGAACVVFPQIEDFGIVAVEAQASGTPVLAFAAGGALDSVVDGRTGAFFDEPTPEALLAGAARIPADTPDRARACRANAERFSEAAFREAIDRHLVDLLPPRPTPRQAAPAATASPPPPAPTATPPP